MTEAECVNGLATAFHAPLGRGPQAFDCWGLVCETCRRMGWPVPFDPMEASGRPEGVQAIFEQHFQSGQWRDSGAVSGAVAFFGEPARAYHAGIVIAGGVLEMSANRGLRHTPVHRVPKNVEYRTWSA